MHTTIVLMGRPKKDATRSMRIKASSVSKLEVILTARNIARREKDVRAASMTLPDLVDELLEAPINKEYPKAIEVISKSRAFN